MPERAKAEQRITDLLIGPQRFSFGEIQSMPPGDYAAVREFASEVYGTVVRRLDWGRVMIEAGTRCLACDHRHLSYDETPCGESVEVALLMYDRPFGEGWQEAEPAPCPQAPMRFCLSEEQCEAMASWVVDRSEAVRAHRDARSAP